MPRLIVLAITINIISSAAFSYGNLITSYKSAEDVFSDSVTLHETQFERIRNVVPNFSTKKFETERNFLAHYNSLKPIAVLIDDTKESHDDAKNFMDRVFQVTPNAKYIPFFLQKFNISGKYHCYPKENFKCITVISIIKNSRF